MSRPLQQDYPRAPAQRHVAILTFVKYLVAVVVVVPVLYYLGYGLAAGVLATLVGLLAGLAGLMFVTTRRVSGIVLVLMMVMLATTFDQPGPHFLLVVIAMVLVAGLWHPRVSGVCALSLVLVVFLAFIVVPSMPKARGAARRMACSNNMKQIVLALQNYHDVYKSFPAAYIPDENGKPKHSWRVLILPFLERWDLYDAYNFDEPWNGPHNRSLLHRTPPALRCPSTTSSEADTTEYFAVVGPSAAWPGSVERKLSDFPDAPSMTIMVMEAAGKHVPWTEPIDLTIEEAIQLVQSGKPSHAGDVRNIAMVDGHVYCVSDHLPRDLWSSVLTINDGAQVSEQDLMQDIPWPPRLKVGTCIRQCVWIAVVLLPLPWLWLNRKAIVHTPPVPG